MTDYPMGATVTFADDSATVSTGEAVVHSGIVNGPPLCDDEGNVRYVLVFASRDNGREATTIIVAVENVLGVSR